MIVDSIGIFELKGPYCMLTMTDWFFQALSVIPRGSWGDFARRFTMIRWFCKLCRSVRSDVDRDYDEVTTMDLKPMFPGPGPDPGPSSITARWSSDTTNQSVTTPMTALDLSGTTQLSAGPSSITARWSSDTTNQSVTTPMTALDLSGTTQLSAGHNMALSQNHRAQNHASNTNTLMLKAVNKSSTRTSVLKFYLKRSYSGTTTSVCSIGFLAGLNNHSRNYLKIQKNQRTLRSDLSKIFERTNSSRFSSNVESGFLTGINQ
ncbi:hypothetical protein F511_14658 [Dorcoceras hygrometricum]|uniref:Uncharacterized protein n=1 Tax=Dorcoceras hygrometricum TaxID=472368 RepID=A0A2Z7BS85_9LAMI|nr:hypothetical protein F511_14658 [Dorcoceras hygrometricum]